jgi:hypothetical protein
MTLGSEFTSITIKEATGEGPGVVDLADAEAVCVAVKEYARTPRAIEQVKGQKGIYLFLNDSTSADGAQEYVVAKRTEDGRYFQLESVTFSWCSRDWALWFVRAVAGGEFDEGQFVREVFPKLEPERNHACHLCA